MTRKRGKEVSSLPCRARLEDQRSPRLPRVLLGIAAVLVASGPAVAEEPLWGEIASTLGKGFVNATTRASLRQMKPYRHHGSAVAMTMEQVEGTVGVEYGVAPDLDVRLKIPYFSQSMEEEFAGQTARHEISGMGEMQAGAKWRFWQAADERHKDELALFADVKLPTGDNDLRDSSGALIAPHLQPNSGNLGATLGLAANRHTALGGHWFSGMVTAETASTRYQRGTMVELYGSTGRRFRRLTRADQTDWMGIAGLQYLWMGKESENGRTVQDSGGSVLCGELSLLASKRTWGFRFGYLFPLRTNVGLSQAPPRREIQGSFRASF